MKKIIGLVVLAATMSSSAMAFDNGGNGGFGNNFGNGGNGGNGGWGNGPGYGPGQGPGKDGGTFAAPEIDPASMLTAMTMLGGGLMVLRGRRSSKQ
jgi:hypothetical protein